MRSGELPLPTENVEAIRLARTIRSEQGRFPVLRNWTPFPAQGGANGHARGKRMAAEGLTAGFPDSVLFHAAGGYHGLCIELKRLKWTPSDVSDVQRAWHDRLRAAGYRVEVCGGWEAAWNVMRDYLEIGA